MLYLCLPFCQPQRLSARRDHFDQRCDQLQHGIHVHAEGGGGGGGSSLRPYSPQRPMRTNLSCCLGLIDNGQHKSTNRLLVLVPHERFHGIMRILENLYMLLPKALKMRAIKDTMALVTDSIGGTKCAHGQAKHRGCSLTRTVYQDAGLQEAIQATLEIAKHASCHMHDAHEFCSLQTQLSSPRATDVTIYIMLVNNPSPISSEIACATAAMPCQLPYLSTQTCGKTQQGESHGRSYEPLTS